MNNWDIAHAVQYANSSTFASTPVKSYTVNGTSHGEYKSAGNLSWLKVFGAGHEVPFYRKSFTSPPIAYPSMEN
jgi:carboxypeptidase D